MSPIDWNQSAKEIHNKIRGLCPWPSANAKLSGKTVKIHKSILSDAVGTKAGEIVQADKKLVVSCGDGNCVELTVVQLEGKK